MAALTSQVELTGAYAVVATAAVRMVVRASRTCQLHIVPTAADAPSADAPGITLACSEPLNFEGFGEPCDVYARGDGVLQVFTNTV